MRTEPLFSGEFLSQKGVVWRCEIWYPDADSSYPAGELTFPASTPLTIEWQNRSKEEVILGSSATLTIISPGDRTFVDLYSIKPGNVILLVYRNGALYWSGTLDPEFYEEPYERLNNYEVSLTFSDFGILDRVKFSGEGMLTVYDAIERAVNECKITWNHLDTVTLVTLCRESGEPYYDLRKIGVRASNFYDEDNEAMSLKEVIEGLLQPLALRMVQRNGVIWIYDLNGLYNKAIGESINWNGDKQTLSTDKVVNNVSIAFSPYVQSQVIDAKADHEKVLADIGDPFIYNYNGGGVTDNITAYSLYHGDDPTGLGLADIGVSEIFRIDAEFSGSDCAGLAWVYPDNLGKPCGPGAALCPPVEVVSPHGAIGTPMIAKTDFGFIPADNKSQPDYRLKISADILYDLRYNPFEEAGESEKASFEHFGKIKKLYIPARLLCYGDDGNVYHYDNHFLVPGNLAFRKEKNTDEYSPDHNPTAVNNNGCGWCMGEGQPGDFWLAYYNSGDLNSVFADGWATNNPAIGSKYFGDLPKFWSKRGSGEYIILPDVTGKIVLEIYAGVYYHAFLGITDEVFDGLTKSVRWMLYKDFSISIVKTTGQEIDATDVEYSSEVNPDAKEPLELSTICGTMPVNQPAARGLYRNPETGKAINRFQRAGICDCPEKLLMGTVYSQYADRHTILSGEAEIDCGDLHHYNERCQGEKKFMIAGEVQDIIADTSEVTIVELTPDYYSES